MKKIMSVFSIITLLILSTGCDDTMDMTSEAMVETKQDSRITTANNTFAFNIFRAINREDLENNIFISPLSISEALTMTYNGAKDSTQEEITSALAFGDLTKEEINSGYKYLNNYLNHMDDQIILEIANSLWIREGINIQQNFIDINQEVFNARVQELDFSKSEAEKIINGWIDQSTKGLITNMIKPPIPEEVIMYLINAIYFKGEWSNPFKATETMDDSFINGYGEEKTIKMMRMWDDILYMEEDNYKAVKLYYGDKKTSMTCILPDKTVDINTFIDSFDYEKWHTLQAELNSEEFVNLSIPKFRMEYGPKELSKSLVSLGMNKVFTTQADLSGIYNGLFITDVLHKAVIEVNEEGSEAAAVTIIECGADSVREPITFVADHPFIFVIWDEEMGNILFIGKAYDL